MSVSSHASKFVAPPTDASGRIPLIGLSLAEMQDVMEVHGLPKFRFNQEGYKGQYRANFSFPRVEGRKDTEIYISAGFGAYGTTSAPLAGEMIASLIAGEPLPVSESLAAILAPERFILRGLRRKQIG